MSILKVLSVFVIALGLAACNDTTENTVESTQKGAPDPAVVEQQITRISEKLKDEPTVKGWLLVGDANMHLKKYDEAVIAYQEAYLLSDNAEVPREKLKRAVFLASTTQTK